MLQGRIHGCSFRESITVADSLSGPCCFASLRRQHVASPDRAVRLRRDTVPASKLLSVELQISEERGVERAVSATHANGLNLPQHHRTEEGALAASADEGDHLGRSKARDG